jgi:hypothetical protein
MISCVAGSSGRRSISPDLSLCQSGGPTERPQRPLLLARTLAPVLSGLPARRHSPVLGPCRQRRPGPLARPSVGHLSPPGGQVLFRFNPC